MGLVLLMATWVGLVLPPVSRELIADAPEGLGGDRHPPGAQARFPPTSASGLPD